MIRQTTSPIRSITRAGREIIIIVCGILMAFALDAWWDLRREAALSDQLFRDLAVEFDRVGSALDYSRGRNNQVIEAADRVLATIRAAKGPVNVSVADVGTLLLTPTTDPLQRNLEALQASGALDLIQSDSLRDLLATWPSEFEDAREEEIAARAFVEEVLIPSLGEILELGEPFRWRIEEILPSMQPGYRASQRSDARGEGTIVVQPNLPLINLLEARRYLSEMVITSLELHGSGHASEITRLLKTLVD